MIALESVHGDIPHPFRDEGAVHISRGFIIQCIEAREDFVFVQAEDIGVDEQRGQSHLIELLRDGHTCAIRTDANDDRCIRIPFLDFGRRDDINAVVLRPPFRFVVVCVGCDLQMLRRKCVLIELRRVARSENKQWLPLHRNRFRFFLCSFQYLKQTFAPIRLGISLNGHGCLLSHSYISDYISAFISHGNRQLI